MKKPDSSRQRDRTLLTAVLLLILFVGYPLSLGPVTWLDKSGLVSRPLMNVILSIYYPIDLLYLHSSGVQRALDWYLDFWV
ncbi:MAG: hypothetical protein AB7O26_05365 [Planctomycetaceae bacterium]